MSKVDCRCPVAHKFHHRLASSWFSFSRRLSSKLSVSWRIIVLSPLNQLRHYIEKKINWFLSSFILCRTTAFLFVSKHIFSAFSLLHSERLVQIKIMQNRKKTREFNVRNQNEKVNEWKRVSEKKLKIKPKARINGRLTGQPANTCL